VYATDFSKYRALRKVRSLIEIQTAHNYANPPTERSEGMETWRPG